MVEPSGERRPVGNRLCCRYSRSGGEAISQIPAGRIGSCAVWSKLPSEFPTGDEYPAVLCDAGDLRISNTVAECGR